MIEKKAKTRFKKQYEKISTNNIRPNNVCLKRVSLKEAIYNTVLKRRMNRRKINQTELGLKVGISSSSMSKIVNGKIIPSPAIAIAIAKILKIKASVLFPETSKYMQPQNIIHMPNHRRRRSFSELNENEIQEMLRRCVASAIDYADEIHMSGLSQLGSHNLYHSLRYAIFLEHWRSKQVGGRDVEYYDQAKKFFELIDAHYSRELRCHE